MSRSLQWATIACQRKHWPTNPVEEWVKVIHYEHETSNFKISCLEPEKGQVRSGRFNITARIHSQSKQLPHFSRQRSKVYGLLYNMCVTNMWGMEAQLLPWQEVKNVKIRHWTNWPNPWCVICQDEDGKDDTKEKTGNISHNLKVLQNCVIWISQKDANEVVFWDVTLCRLVHSYRRFGGAYCLHLQGLTLFLDYLILNMETPGPLRNFGNYLQVNTA
jgi:hypothetical protein